MMRSLYIMKHAWSAVSPLGVTYDRRHCTRCGMAQVRTSVRRLGLINKIKTYFSRRWNNYIGHNGEYTYLKDAYDCDTMQIRNILSE